MHQVEIEISRQRSKRGVHAIAEHLVLQQASVTLRRSAVEVVGLQLLDGEIQRYSPRSPRKWLAEHVMEVIRNTEQQHPVVEDRVEECGDQAHQSVA